MSLRVFGSTSLDMSSRVLGIIILVNKDTTLKLTMMSFSSRWSCCVSQIKSEESLINEDIFPIKELSLLSMKRVSA